MTMVSKPLTNPFAMNDAVMQIGLGRDTPAFDDYTEAVSQAELQPTTSTASWTGIGGNQLTFQSPTTWLAAVAIAQDNSEAGLSDFLFDNDGKEAVLRLFPKAGGRGWEADVILSPTAIGGTSGNTAAVGTANFAVQGRPRKITAPVEP